MSDFYTNLKDNTVVPLLTQYGTALTVNRYEDTATWERKIDNIEGRVYWENINDQSIVYDDPTGTPTEYTSVGVLTRYKNNEIDGTLIKMGDMKLLTVDIPEPQTGDTFELNSVVFNYVDHEIVSPDNTTTVLFKVQVRK